MQPWKSLAVAAALSVMTTRDEIAVVVQELHVEAHPGISLTRGLPAAGTVASLATQGPKDVEQIAVLTAQSLQP